MNKKKIKLLKRIFETAIYSFDYITDQEQFGKIEHWNCPVLDGRGRIQGDCEDFALYCRKLCREAEFKTELVYCLIEPPTFGNGPRGHMVLHIEGQIMDNRRMFLTTVSKLKGQGYEFIAMSGQLPGDPWHYIIETDK